MWGWMILDIIIFILYFRMVTVFSVSTSVYGVFKGNILSAGDVLGLYKFCSFREGAVEEKADFWT